MVIPAHDCERSIVGTIESVLNQSLPPDELIVVPNGSDEHNRKIVEAIRKKYKLKSYEPIEENRRILFEKPYAFYAWRNIKVLCKVFGNKADAMNAALFYSTGEYFATVDADTTLENHCLEELLKVATADAVGGLVYPISPGATLLSTIQLMEYETSFLVARRLFNALNCTLLLSGALSMFRKDVLSSAGGFLANTVGEDMEIVVRLQEACKYKIEYAPKAVCFTSIPPNFKALFRQRMRWHMGLMEVMRLHKRMLFNPKYGTRGLVAMPYLLIVELLSPFIVPIGAIITGILYFTKAYSVQGIFLPYMVMLAIYEAEMLLTYRLHTRRFGKKNGPLLWLAIGLIEIFAYRPALNVAKLKAMIKYKDFKGKWLRAR